MVFSSPFFLTIFLPLVVAGCWLLGWLEERWGARRGRPSRWVGVNLLLLLASLVFYAWGEGLGVGWLMASVLFNALCARQIHRHESARARGGWLAFCLVVNLLFLGWFKYVGFAVHSLDRVLGLSLPVPEVALPLGISFYTFQALSYVVDVYRRQVPPARSLTDFACYVTMFPQLVAGPIVRYADIAAQLVRRTVTLDQVASGWKRFLCGLGKKVLLANTMGEMADAVWRVVEQGNDVPVGMAWIGLACYTLQIYYDFSGYSDMAIGLGRLLGFEFLENFRHPYASRSVREFWRRWHISLSTWFRDYVYIPLGGNRISPARTGLNCLLVFGLCGLWHGASVVFILWGLWHGLFLMLERGRPDPGARPGGRARVAALGGHLYTLAVVLVGWVLFRSPTLDIAARYFRCLAGVGEPGREARVLWLDLSPKVVLALLIGLFLAYPIVPWARAGIRRAGARTPALVELAEWLILTFIGLTALLMIAGGAYNPFIYFRF